MDLVSPYVLALAVAWFLAHVVKYAIALSRGKQLDLTHQLFISGGMPSSHAATSVAVWMVVLLKDGPQSGLFGLATLVVLVICYDAVKVRRSSGEQGEAIQQLIKEQNSKVDLPRAAKGHTPVEVVAGSIFGAIIGLVVFLATR
jgi:acid phosphatase family membrane protein YuiD